MFHEDRRTSIVTSNHHQTSIPPPLHTSSSVADDDDLLGDIMVMSGEGSPLPMSNQSGMTPQTPLDMLQEDSSPTNAKQQTTNLLVANNVNGNSNCVVVDSSWQFIIDVIFTLILGTKESSLTSKAVPKYFSKGKFIEQPIFRANKQIIDRQTRACIAFLSIYIICLFVFNTLDIVYVVARYTAFNVLGAINVCMCVLFYLMLRARFYQIVRLFSIVIFTAVPYVLLTLSVIYGKELRKNKILLFSHYHSVESEQSTTYYIGFLSVISVIIAPVLVTATTSSPVLIFLVAVINFVLVSLQPIWFTYYMPLNYGDYFACIFTLTVPMVFLVLLNSYMHCIDIVQVQEGERRYKNILGLTTEAIVVQDAATGTIVDVNPSFQKCFGYTPKECRELSIEDFLNVQMKVRYEYSDKHTQNVIYEKLKSGSLNSWGECLGINRDGIEFPVEVVFKQSEYNGREVDVYVIRDLRARKEIQKQYEAAQNARSELQTRTKFFAMVSHDLKTPLNSIYLIAQKLLEKYEDKDSELVTMIIDSCQILSNIVKDVLYSTKLDSGSLSLEVVRFNLKRCIEKVVSISGVTALRKGLDVALEFDLRPTSAKFPVFVYGDSSKFQQILTNLLGNAIKFTQSGSVIVRVEVQEQTYNSVKLYISVKDTGIGIPLKKQPKLFKMFSRAHDDRKYEGTGLGLAICKNLCSLMKGEVGVRSSYGAGSEFWFTSVFRTQSHSRHPSLEPSRVPSRRVSSTSSYMSNSSTDPSSRRGSLADAPSPSQDLRRKSVVEFALQNIEEMNDSSKELHIEDEEDSLSYYDDSLPSMIEEFCRENLNNTVALVIYKDENVRASVERYLTSLSMQYVSVSHCDTFFTDSQTVTNQLYSALYGSSEGSMNKDEWPVKVPISLVIIDDQLLLVPVPDSTKRRVSVVGLFEPMGASGKKYSSSSSTSSRYSTSMPVTTLERMYKTVNRLKFLIASHNLKCDEPRFPGDQVYYGCLYYTFDISYMKEFCTSVRADTDPEEIFFDIVIRKPLSATGIEKLMSAMMDKYEYAKAQNHSVEDFFDDQSDMDNMDNYVFGSPQTSALLSSYQFPPPAVSLSPRNSALKAFTNARQRKSGPTEIRMFSGHINYRKSSVPAAIYRRAYQPSNTTSITHQQPTTVSSSTDSSVRPRLRSWKSTENVYKNQNQNLSEVLQKEMVNVTSTLSDRAKDEASEITPILQKRNSLVEAEKENELTVNTLVADDNDINRKIVMRTLQDCSSADPNSKTALSIMKTLGLKAVHIKATPATNGESALQEFVQQSVEGSVFDLLLLDVHMDGMDGLECTRKIRAFEQEKHRPRTKIVGLTGDSDAKQECLSAGMDHVLFKPVKKETLRKLTEEVIRTKLKQTM
jgi:PAS domain S-box-containing protein